MLSSSTFRPLINPFQLDGVGGSVTVTHCGRLIHLPAPFNKAYYSAGLTYNLFSLGVVQRLGGFYTVDPFDQLRLLIKSSQHGRVIATACLSDTNLLPFTIPTNPLSSGPASPPSNVTISSSPVVISDVLPSVLAAQSILEPSIPVVISAALPPVLAAQSILEPSLPVVASDVISSVLAAQPTSEPSLPLSSASLFSYDVDQLNCAGYHKQPNGCIVHVSYGPPCSESTTSSDSDLSLSPISDLSLSSSLIPDDKMLLLSSSLPIPQYSSEQRSRAKLALDLHEYNHESNQSNGHSCENGIISLSLTGQDFTAADDIYGACGACVSKRNSTITHGSTSNSPPPITAGQLLHADLLKLEDGSLVILTKDDYCGFLRPVKLFGGKTKGAVQAGWDKIRLYYNERGFVLSQVNTDSEEIFKESASILQERGILCSLSPPEVHEKSLERSWQTVAKRMNVVRQSLEYELPLGLEFTLLEHVCDILNSSGNSKFLIRLLT